MNTTTHNPEADEEQAAGGRIGAIVRIVVASLIVLAALAAACLVMVPAGEAVVITRFGDPVRVLNKPGLAIKWPAPFENAVAIDLRLRTTSTGVQDVGTKDGLRVLVQSYAAWQVPSDPQDVRQFLRAVRNEPDEAARQLRTLVSSALHLTASSFSLDDLVNTDPSKVKLDVFEQQLQQQVAPRVRQVYGIDIRMVGIERMTLPEETLTATVNRMKAERETEAQKRTSAGNIKAASIRSDAERDAREIVAKAREQAAQTEADGAQEASRIYANAYKADPSLYATLRSVDALDKMVTSSTGLLLRTDAAPFRALVDGPSGAAEPSKAPAAGKPAPK